MTHRSIDPIFSSVELDKRIALVADDLQAFVAGAATLVMERTDIETTLEEMGDRVPKTQRDIYHRRLPDLEKELDQRRRLAEAISRYDPYSIPGGFAVGFAEVPSDAKLRQLDMMSALVFNAPIPREQMMKYIDAKESQIFDEIVVASSDKSLFRQVNLTPPPRPIFVDPFMVGLVYLPDFYQRPFRIGTNGNQVRGAHGFLISHWDLSREISAS